MGEQGMIVSIALWDGDFKGFISMAFVVECTEGDRPFMKKTTRAFRNRNLGASDIGPKIPDSRVNCIKRINLTM